MKACEKELVSFDDMGTEDVRLHGREMPIGANLALRASLFLDQPPFVPELGRTTTDLMNGAGD